MTQNQSIDTQTIPNLDEIRFLNFPRYERVGLTLLADGRRWTMTGQQTCLIREHEDLLYDALDERVPIPSR